MTTQHPTYVALLRGINVGARHRLPMADLTLMFQSCGGCAVRTYIQSGNVLFRATDAEARRVEGAVKAALVERLGNDIPIVLRTGAELARIVSESPFLGSQGDSRSLHVGFLRDRPTSARIADLDPRRSPPDEFAVRGREIYLRLPNGAARTKLTNRYFDRTLGTSSTFRNWRTVLKLAELSGT